jgi:hypothetical protein
MYDTLLDRNIELQTFPHHSLCMREYYNVQDSKKRNTK